MTRFFIITSFGFKSLRFDLHHIYVVYIPHSNTFYRFLFVDQEILTHVLPMLHFWRFQGVQKCNIGRIWVNLESYWPNLKVYDFSWTYNGKTKTLKRCDISMNKVPAESKAIRNCMERSRSLITKIIPFLWYTTCETKPPFIQKVFMLQ